MPSLRTGSGVWLSFGVLVALVLAALAVPQAQAQDATTPSWSPSTATPKVEDGAVHAIAEVGSQIVLGGTFTRASNYGGGQPSLTRTYVLAFDRETGALSTTFAPVLNGAVNDVAPGPTAGTVYVAGAFTTVNGAKTSKVVLLDLATGNPVPGFRAAAMNGAATSIALVGSQLYVGGLFTTVGGETRGGLASLSATTGAVTGAMAIQLARRHNDSGSGAQGAVGVKELDVTPDGSRMVVIGNFKTADGLPRDQVLLADLGATATVRADWRTRRYEPYCFSWSYDSYMRGVAFSPDGAYFVIATTGGKNVGTLCDTAARFETAGTGQEVQPTWIDHTGGDTLWGVAITGDAVYVGGHQRWMNNVDGNDSPGQGSVPRPGLAALDTSTGLPLAWNPGRNPRGAAAFEIFPGSRGLYVGSDTEWIGNRTSFRPRIAMFPYAGGAAQASAGSATLPGDLLVASGGTLTRRTFDGTIAGPPTIIEASSWSNARGGFWAGGNLYHGSSDGYLYRRSWDGRTLGPAARLDPYLDPAWVGVDTGSNASYGGRVPSIYGSALANDVQALAYSRERIYYARSTSSTLQYRSFSTDSGIVGSEVFSVSSPIDFRRVGGMFVSDGFLYYTSTLTGAMSRIAFDGTTTSGSPTTVSNADWRNRLLALAPTHVEPPPVVSDISHVGSSRVAVNAASAAVAVPQTEVGDALVMVVAAGVTTPGTTVPAGWTLRDSRVDAGLWSGVYTRAAGAGDAGTTVPVTFSATTKATVTIGAWRNASPTIGATAIASSVDAGTATHTAPTVAAPSGAWVVTAWADKSATTTVWTPPAGVQQRAAAYGTGAGRVTSLLVDGGAPVPPGPVGGLTATTDAASSRGVAWTIALAPTP
ncbi:hypothetical protein [Nocardioides sp. SYSU D00038]|uniref:hypothetical protein n=1 Tax=Nocardioides sp. SYSU D00038 TaxID=2812554 RepID=UPI0019677251|nr:hypothetical protein [Nocardioides sp. SYSU D00038]